MNKPEFRITYARFRFIMEAEEDCLMPPYMGSTLRGAMGHALRQMTCVIPHGDCKACMHRWQCAYAYIMATGREETDSGGQARVQAIPAPYVIEPYISLTDEYKKGDCLSFHLLLIGKSISLLPLFITAFEKAGATGLGKGRKKFILKQVEQEQDHVLMPIWSGGNQFISPPVPIEINIDKDEKFIAYGITIQLETPLRLVDRGRLNDRPAFSVLMRAVFRRLDALGKIHGDGGLGIDYHSYLESASQVSISHSHASWYDWERFSSTQDTFMKLGGLIGELSYTGDLALFLPFLRMTEILHAGKNTSFGLGRYRLMTKGSISKQGGTI